VPIDVQFDADLQLLVVTIAGSWPTLPDIVAQRSRLVARGLLKPGVVELIDIRSVARLPNVTEMRAILEAFGAPSRKRAIVVETSLQFNAGKRAEALEPRSMKVFREEADALAWLLAARHIDAEVEVDRTGKGRVPVVWGLRA